jgi:hypothetical protein
LDKLARRAYKLGSWLFVGIFVGHTIAQLSTDFGTPTAERATVFTTMGVMYLFVGAWAGGESLNLAQERAVDSASLSSRESIVTPVAVACFSGSHCTTSSTLLAMFTV